MIMNIKRNNPAILQVNTLIHIKRYNPAILLVNTHEHKDVQS